GAGGGGGGGGGASGTPPGIPPTTPPRAPTTLAARSSMMPVSGLISAGRRPGAAFGFTSMIGLGAAACGGGGGGGGGVGGGAAATNASIIPGGVGRTSAAMSGITINAPMTTT